MVEEIIGIIIIAICFVVGFVGVPYFTQEIFPKILARISRKRKK